MALSCGACWPAPGSGLALGVPGPIASRCALCVSPGWDPAEELPTKRARLAVDSYQGHDWPADLGSAGDRLAQSGSLQQDTSGGRNQTAAQGVTVQQQIDSDKNAMVARQSTAAAVRAGAASKERADNAVAWYIRNKGQLFKGQEVTAQHAVDLFKTDCKAANIRKRARLATQEWTIDPYAKKATSKMAKKSEKNGFRCSSAQVAKQHLASRKDPDQALLVARAWMEAVQRWTATDRVQSANKIAGSVNAKYKALGLLTPITEKSIRRNAHHGANSVPQHGGHNRKSSQALLAARAWMEAVQRWTATDRVQSANKIAGSVNAKYKALGLLTPITEKSIRRNADKGASMPQHGGNKRKLPPVVFDAVATWRRR